MAEERIDIIVKDDVPGSIADKFRGMADAARKAEDALEKLKGELREGIGALTAHMNAEARLTNAKARLIQATNQQSNAQDRATLSAQRLATEQARTAAATSRAQAAAAQAATAQLRLAQAQDKAAQSATRQRAANTAMAGSLASVGNAAGALGVVFGAAGAVYGGMAIVRLSDQYTKLQNALRVTGLEGAELARVYGVLNQQAMANYAPVDSLVELYRRATLVQNELNASSAQIENFTNRIAQALRVQGVSATDARGPLLQLAQALGSGVVRAEEFNSLVEGTPVILQAVARGLTEAGGSVARLRTLVLDGQLSSEAFFAAFEAGSVTLEEQLESSERTVSQAMENLRTSLMNAVGEMNEATGASEALSDAIVALAGIVDNADFGYFISEVNSLLGVLAGAAAAANQLGLALGDLLGISWAGPALGGQIQPYLDRARNAVNTAIEGRRASYQVGRAFADEGQGVVGNLGRYGDGSGGVSGTQNAILAAALNQQADALRPPPTEVVVPVSLNDFAPPTKPGGTGGRGRGGGKGGGRGRSGRGAISDLERELQRVTGPLENYKKQLTSLDALLQKGQITQEAYNAAVGNLALVSSLRDIDKKLPGFATAAELAELNQNANEQISIIQMANEAKILNEQQTADRIRAIRQQLNADTTNLMVEQYRLGAEAMSSGFGELASVLQNAAGEQSGIYRAMFAVSKAFAVAEASIAMYQNIAKAMAVGFPANLPFIGQAIAQGASIISSIQSVTAPRGFAAGGYTGNAPRNASVGTVHGREYVMDAAATKAIGVSNLDYMRRNRSAIVGSGGGGDARPVNINFDKNASALVMPQKMDNGDIRIIAREEAKAMVRQEAPRVIATDIGNPNSRTSKALQTNTTADRKR